MMSNKSEYMKTYMKDWRSRNLEKIREYHRLRYAKNCEQVKARARQAYLDNTETIKARNQAYAARNQDKIKAARVKYWHGSRKHKEKTVWMTYEGRAKKLLGSCRCSSRSRGLDFAIGLDDILVQLSTGHCAATGLPFDMSSTRGPFRPSIDRIDSRKGYVPGNIQVVAWMYNAAKQQYTADDVITMARALVEKQPEPGAAT